MQATVMVSVATFTKGEEVVFHQIATKLQSPYSFCFDTFGVSQVKSNVGPSDTFGVKLGFGTPPAWAYTRTHTGKTSRLFPRALCAGEIARGFWVDIFGKSKLRSKGFRGNPVSTNLIGD